MILNKDTPLITKDIKEEKIKSLEQMLEMTTAYMAEVEQELKRKNALLEDYKLQSEQSLSFSSLLQNAIQPSEQTLQSYFSDSFIINRPKNIIGGDFTWSMKQNGLIYVACMDCTGHGIPGAMLSMAAYFSLSASFEKKAYRNPEELLQDFNKQFYTHFHLNDSPENRIKHGLDIGLAIIDPAQKSLQYAGTHQSLVRMDGNTQEIYKGSRSYIGNDQLELKSYKIKMNKDDRFFMFTDGVTDQFGGSQNKKILLKRILKILREGYHLTMKNQSNLIETALSNWQGTEEQTDDMLMIGFKLN